MEMNKVILFLFSFFFRRYFHVTAEPPTQFLKAPRGGKALKVTGPNQLPALIPRIWFERLMGAFQIEDLLEFQQTSRRRFSRLSRLSWLFVFLF